MTAWPLVKLTDICSPKQWPTISKTQLEPSGYPVFGANGRIGWFSKYNHEQPTILITCRGATCGSINVCEPKSYVTGNAMALDSLDERRVDFRFLVRALESADFSAVITGVAQPQITRQSLSRLEVPLPPLAEQKRIAKILDAADALRAKRRESIEELDKLVQSTFLDMFGDPIANTMGWKVIKLDDCSLGIVDGPFGSNLKTSDYVDSGVPVLQGKNITGNKFRWMDVRYITREKARALKRSEVRIGDHLLIKIGSIGYSAVLDSLNGHEFAIIPANMVRVRRNPEIVEEAFLHGFLTSERVGNTLRSLASKTAQPALSLKKIKSLEIPIPPLRAQKQFGDVAKSVSSQQLHLHEHLAQLDALFASLQSRAFRGEL